MTLVTQRTPADCGIAVLATLLSDWRVPYEAIYDCVATRIHPDAPMKGLHHRELLAIAQCFGLELAPARTYDLDRDQGILRLYSPDHSWSGHFVAVRDGLVWDPMGAAAPWRTYRRQRRAKFGTLLRLC